MYYVRTYFDTHNLGDAIQTYALCRLLPGKCEGWPGDTLADGRPFVVNGWLGRRPVPDTKQTVFAGVYISNRLDENYGWAGKSASLPVGTRDPYTLRSLVSRQIPSVFVGCATITLPTFRGTRSGIVRIDDGTSTCLTNNVAAGTGWHRQWTSAIERIEMIRRAALVLTRRLHVVLPCLAMGTPVEWHPSGDEARERFSILDELGIPPGPVERFDADRWKQNYLQHLSRQLNCDLHDCEPEFPHPRASSR